MASSHGLFAKREEEKEVTIDLDTFNPSRINPLIEQLDKYLKDNGTSAPSAYWAINTLLSYTPGAKYVGLRTNQPFASAVKNVLNDAKKHSEEKESENNLLIILNTLEKLLALYDEHASTDFIIKKYHHSYVTSVIDNAFIMFLKIPPSDMPISRERFKEIKQEILASTQNAPKPK